MSETLVSHSAFPTSFPVRGNAGGSADVDSSEEEVGMNARRTLPAQPTYGCKPIYDPKPYSTIMREWGGPGPGSACGLTPMEGRKREVLWGIRLQFGVRQGQRRDEAHRL